MKRTITLKTMIQISFIIVSSLPIIYLGIYQYKNQTDSFLKETTLQSMNMVKNLEAAINQFDKDNRSILKSFSYHPVVIAAFDKFGSDKEINKVILEYYRTFASVESIYLGTSDGTLHSRKKALVSKGYDPRKRPWYKLAVSSPNTIMLTDPYENATKPGSYAIAYAMAVTDKATGKVKGVVGCDIKLAPLEEHLSKLEMLYGCSIIVTDEKGNILFGKYGNIKDIKNINKDMVKQLNGQKNASPIQLMGEKYLFHKEVVNSIGWHILMLLPQSALIDRQDKILYSVGITILFIVALAWFFSVNIVRRILKKLEYLVEQIKHIHLESIPDEIEPVKKMPYELKVIRDTLNEMARRIQKQAYELNDLIDMLRESNMETIQALSNAIEANDYYTKGHCSRVTHYALLLAKHVGLNQDEMDDLERAAVLHDVGKVAIPTDILNKNGSFTAEEYDIVKKHSEYGYKITNSISFLEKVSKIIKYHHERVDGKGYPEGLYGEELEVSTKILSIVDAYDAMTSKRAYRMQPLTNEQALEQLRLCSNSQFDAGLVEIFIKIAKQDDFLDVG